MSFNFSKNIYKLFICIIFMVETLSLEVDGRKRILDIHRDSPLVRDILYGKTDFVREVEDFYDAQSFYVPYEGEVFEVYPRRDEKSGEYPAQLVEILESFNDGQEFDTNGLEYDSVREGITRFNKSRKRAAFMMKRIGDLAIVFGISSVVGVISLIGESYSTAGVAGGVALASGGGFYISKKLVDQKEIPKYTPFKNLHEASKGAFNYTHHYRNLILDKGLKIEAEI